VTTRTPPSITLREVSKWYGEVLGLNEVSIDFGPGVAGLLGPNGAGKSTMLKLISGMLRPDIGTVEICGSPTFNHPQVMQRVGLCPEQDALYPNASALSVVNYLTKLQGFSRREARVRAGAALERAGIGHVQKRSVGGFSKGMRQRFKLAQALAHDPDVLILDEPLNGLDPTGRREFTDILRDLADEGRCVLVSSHILHEVESMARRIVVINAGRLLADGTPREIRHELSQFPLQVRIDTPDGSALAGELAGLAGIRRIEISDSGLIVLTHQIDVLLDHVTDRAAAKAIRINGILPLDEDLEAVFRYLTQ
jgi:ABC-2 type transport system ATP-binding protein